MIGPGVQGAVPTQRDASWCGHGEEEVDLKTAERYRGSLETIIFIIWPMACSITLLHTVITYFAAELLCYKQTLQQRKRYTASSSTRRDAAMRKSTITVSKIWQ